MTDIDETLTAKHINVEREYRQQARRSRWYTTISLSLAIAIAGGALLYANAANQRADRNAVSLVQIKHIVETTDIELKAIQDATSPQARQQTRDLVSGAVLQINCAQRDNFMALVKGLEESGQLTPGSVQIQYTNCP